MSNTKLLFENQEVELTNSVTFPLNKAFENLWNPTDIIVEHSKSINIPATVKNNKIMANAYRIDRQFVTNTEGDNIGMYLDPLKRIPMKLIYNGEIILDGYAKYTSSVINDKTTYYTFNLYGALGDIFQTLLDCVVDENKLTDEQKAEDDKGAKYVIKSLWEERIIDRTFVAESWSHNDIDFEQMYNPHNCIGMAPAYRGLYDNFESNSGIGITWNGGVLGSPNVSKSLEDELKGRWSDNLKQKGFDDEYIESVIDALDFDSIVKDGISEHQMQQFRSYEQKPYIYLHTLLKLFQNKCKELTKYNISLDPSWFSPNNPYYANMCYMLDYLSVKGNALSTTLPFTGYTEQQYTDVTYTTNSSGLSAEGIFTACASYNITDTNILSNEKITITPFTIGIRQMVDKKESHDYSKCHVLIDNATKIVVRVEITDGTNVINKYFWGSTGTIGETGGLLSPDKEKYDSNNFIKMTQITGYNKNTNKLTGTAYITIPKFEFEHKNGNSLSVKYFVSAHCFSQGNGQYVLGRYSYGTSLNSLDFNYLHPSINNPDFSVVYPNVEYHINWRNSTKCSLKNLYTSDEPLFKVILQYTKMAGLIWKVDYKNRNITIMPRHKYFEDYKIVDWTKKLDKSKGLTIEPVSFDSKYVIFNYENVEGYRYSGYKKKYSVNYGEKKMRTKYNFDNKETKFFKEKIYPSSVSCKGFATISDLANWDTLSVLPITSSEINFIDSENEEQRTSISLNNWYFRCSNKETTTPYYISDASSIELQQDKYFWVGNWMLNYYNVGTQIYTLPQFSPVYKSNINGNYYGCLFNCPNDDYTYDNQITNANNNYMYDVCWSEYINERYNANNKKVICYLTLSPVDFQQFNFKTFVVIDNQLFVVNKIFDFDVNNKVTKVELIQVSNIEGYTKQRVKFPPIAFSETELHINTTENATDGMTSIMIKGYPLSDIQWSIEPGQSISGNSDCFIEDTEYIGNTVTLYITYESDVKASELWHLKITYLDNNYIIPIYVNY